MQTNWVRRSRPQRVWRQSHGLRRTGRLVLAPLACLVAASAAASSRHGHVRRDRASQLRATRTSEAASVLQPAGVSGGLRRRAAPPPRNQRPGGGWK